MSDDGEKTCPLCAEEMDLTDQQLRPCKCGYEICVWCWHHIMEMAEKEDLEGRCPACRTRYDKERIVGMAANCERMVAEISAERKNKSQKAKSKASIEARKHLNGVRVVKRNLVYITGLPSNLADESIIERKEYFGQYGKVLKVSISRTTSTTTAQQASNSNTFSVYITYAREEEAIRCIQAVHNYILEGKPLRACFGTTKYCHSWLRNMTCSNPDCLYLHDVGSQEDSFTKDEIISAYTRGRVPQSASNNLQRCSGSVLPPPLDDWYNDGAVSGRHVQKSASNNTVSQVKGSPSISNDGRSTVLPAAASWGSRRPPAAIMACSQIPVKQKAEMLNCSSSLSSVVASTTQTSAWHDDAITSDIPEGRNMMHMNHMSRPSERTIGMDSQTTASDVSSETNLDSARTSGISAWNDGVPSSNMPEGVHMKGRPRHVQPLRPDSGRDSLTSVLDVTNGNVLDEACPSAWDDDVVTTSQIPNERHLIQSETLKPVINRDCQTSASCMSSTDMNASQTSGISFSCSSSHQSPAPENKGECISVSGGSKNLVNSSCPEVSYRRSSSSVPDEVSNAVTVEGNVENICSGLASVNIDCDIRVDYPSKDQHQSSVSNDCSKGLLGNLASKSQQYYPEQGYKCLATTSSGKHSLNSDFHVSSWLSSDSQVHVLASTGNVMGDALVADDESSSLAEEHHPLNFSNGLSNSFWNNEVGKTCFSSVNGDRRTVGTEVDKGLLSFRENGHVVPTACKEEISSSSAKLGKVFEGPATNNTEKEVKYLGRYDDLPNIGKTTAVDMGESSIITDILSLDFDPWGDSLSPANNFAKLLGEMDKQDGPSKLSSSWKLQHSNQSRFSFAQQENQANFLDTSFRSTGNAHKISSSSHDPYGDRFLNGSQINSFEGSNGLLNRDLVVSSDSTAGVSRAKMSAPPGFRVPNRAPPPGFSSHDRYGRSHETCSDNHLLGNSPILNQYQVHSAGSAGDVEFIDPAILAVGKGILPISVNSSGLGSRSLFPPSPFTPSGNDPRLPPKQQYISTTHQDPRIPEHIGDRFLQSNDGYISPGLLPQNHRRQPQFAQASHQQPRTSHVLSSQWDGWNDIVASNDIGMSEMFRNNRFGL